MRFGRLMTVTGIVSFAAAGGLFVPAYGQSTGAAKDTDQRREVVRKKAVDGDRVVIRKGVEGPRVHVEALPTWEAELADDLVMFDGQGAQVGLAVRDVEAADASKQKLPSQAGAVVEEVRKESAGAKAGVKTGDVIVAFDGERVRSARQLDRLVEETPAGRAVKMTVMRDGAKLDVDITPEQRGPMSTAMTLSPDAMAPLVLERRLERGVPAVEAFPAVPFELEKFDEFGKAEKFGKLEKNFFAFAGGRSRLGVQVDSVDDQLAKYFGVESGLLVRHVAEDSPAAKAGVKAGDVITAIGGKPVTDVSDIRAALQDEGKGKEVEVSLVRDKKAMSVKVAIESPEKVRPRVKRTI